MRACVVAAAVLLAFPAAASAHVEMDPDRVTPGSFTLFTVLSPDESTQPLSGLRLTIPSGMEVDSAADTPGFATTLVRDQAHRIVAISWQGGSVQPDHLGLFRFSASVGSSTGTVHLTALQTFADGSTKLWHTPEVAVAGEGGSSDTVARALAGGAAVVALAVAGLAAWRRC